MNREALLQTTFNHVRNASNCAAAFCSSAKFSRRIEHSVLICEPRGCICGRHIRKAHIRHLGPQTQPHSQRLWSSGYRHRRREIHRAAGLGYFTGFVRGCTGIVGSRPWGRLNPESQRHFGLDPRWTGPAATAAVTATAQPRPRPQSAFRCISVATPHASNGTRTNTSKNGTTGAHGLRVRRWTPTGFPSGTPSKSSLGYVSLT